MSKTSSFLARSLPPFLIFAGTLLATLYLGPFREDYLLSRQAVLYGAWGLMVGTWLVVRLVRRQRLAKTAVDWPLWSLLLAYALAAVFSLDPRRSFSLAGQVGVYALLFWMAADLLAAGWPRLAFIDAMLWASGLVSFLTFLEIAFWYLSWYGLGGSAHPLPPFTYRVTSWLGHANLYASMIVGLAPLALARAWQSRRVVTRLMVGLWAVLALVDLVYASSRGGWLVLFASLALFALLLIAAAGSGLQSIRKFLKTRKAAAITVAAGVLLGLVAIGSVAFRQFTNPTHGALLSSRNEYWPAAWQMITAAPILGSGPDTYYRFWLQDNPGLAPNIATNPLNIYLEVASETGLVGLAMFLLLIAAAAWKIIGAFRNSAAGERLWLAAISAGLAGILAHAVTEITPFLFPVVLFFILLMALALSFNPKAAQLRQAPAWPALIFFAGLALFGGWTARSQAWFEQGVALGKAGRWLEASDLIEKASGADPDFAWYQLEAGYAQGMAALADPIHPNPAQLDLAIQHYRAGIALEPAYPVNYANLAILYWKAGQMDEAIAQMKTAVNRSSTSPVYLLTLGQMLEKSGDPAGASQYYRQAASTDPTIRQAAFWQTSPAAEQAWQSWQSPESTPAPGMSAGFKALETGDLAEARRQFANANASSPFSPDPYRGLGLAAWRSGDLALAEYDLQTALRAYGEFGNKTSPIQILLDLGDLYAAQGKMSQSLDFGMQAFGRIEDYGSFGPGTLGYNIYPWWVFHRTGFTNDLLPGFARADMREDLAERFTTLAWRLTAAGRVKDACRIHRRILQSVPGQPVSLQAIESCP